jgi:hypothetical protein
MKKQSSSPLTLKIAQSTNERFFFHKPACSIVSRTIKKVSLFVGQKKNSFVGQHIWMEFRNFEACKRVREILRL